MLKITVMPADEVSLKNIAAGNSVDVDQEVEGSDKTFTITYKMRPNKKGEWMLRNVSIESINVGRLYRNQFEAAMKKHQGNFSVVIDEWVVEAKDLDKEREEIKQAL